MADNNYIEIVARLNEKMSTQTIQDQLDKIKNNLSLQLDNVQISTTGISTLQTSIDTIQKNLHLNIGSVAIDQTQIAKQAQQISQNLVSSMTPSVDLSGIKRAYSKISTIQDKLNAEKIGGFTSQSELSQYINNLLKGFKGITTSVTSLNEVNKAINGFKIEVKNADRVTESLAFHIKDIQGAGSRWTLSGFKSSDNSIRNMESDARKLNTEFKTLTHYWQMMENLSERSILGKNKDSTEVQNLQAQITWLDKAYNIFKKHFEAAPQNPRLTRYVSELQQAIISANSDAHNLVRTLSEQQISINHTEEVNNLKTLYNNLRASDVVLDEFKADYQELNALLSQAQTTGDYTQYFTQLDVFKSKFAEAKSEIRATNAEISDLASMAKQLQSNKMTNFFSRNAGDVRVTGLKTEITGLITEWDALNKEIAQTGQITPSTQTKIDSLRTRMEQTTVAADQLQKNIKEVANAQKLATQKQSLDTRITSWLQNNTRASQETIAKLKEMQAQIQTADHQTMTNLNNQFREVTANARAAGEAGMKMGDVIKQKLRKFAGWFSIATVVMRSVNELKNMYREVVELDTALVDLRKTTDGTNAELEQFYIDANKIGKDLGVTTKEVIEAASSWSRLGYSLKDAQEMAKTSSIFASISPGMNIEQATDGLVSAMKAYKIEASDALDEIASKINAVGNTQALNNSDIVEFLTRSSSAMAEANNSLEETIALGTAATEITRDASSVGNTLKTVSMRIRGYDEETNQLSDDLKNISGEIADLTKTAEHPIGISLFTDDAKTEYKSTTQILRDISAIYDELSDKQQAKLLEKLAGKRNGQVVAAILNNFEAVEKSLDTMANSAGNAEAEMSVITDSIEYKTNRLKETAVGIAQDIFQRDSTKQMVDNLTSLLEVINSLTKSVGGLGTAFTAFMAYKGFKNVGRTKMFVLNNRICRQQ